MSTTIATKQDLQFLKQEMENRFALVDARFTLMDQKIDALRSDLTRDLAAMDLRITVKLGSMMVIGFSLTIAAMRMWL